MERELAEWQRKAHELQEEQKRKANYDEVMKRMQKAHDDDKKYLIKIFIVTAINIILTVVNVLHILRIF